jgi:hypothetical protein
MASSGVGLPTGLIVHAVLVSRIWLIVRSHTRIVFKATSSSNTILGLTSRLLFVQPNAKMAFTSRTVATWLVLNKPTAFMVFLFPYGTLSLNINNLCNIADHNPRHTT